MPSLQIERYGNYQIQFRFQGRRYKRSLNTKDEAEATFRKQTIEETIALLNKGRLRISERVDPATFILADGNVTESDEPKEELNREPKSNGQPTPPPSLTLARFFQAFFYSIPDDNLERETLYSMRVHRQHFLRILTPEFSITTVKLQDLQRYVNIRAKEYTQFLVDKPANATNPKRTKVSATTISI